MTVHIFILHYEKEEETKQCLSSLLDGDTHVWTPCRIFVIDNGSPEPFRYDGQDYDVIRLPNNLFLIDAFNEAMKANPADGYICMANDTRPTGRTINKLVSALRHKDVGIVAPGTNDRGVGVLYVGDQEDPGLPSVESTNVDNTCWGFRQDLVDVIGWPDCEGHTHRACWASNQDYCYRARQAGYKVLAVRGAFNWHAHDGGKDMNAYAAGQAWLQKKWGDLAPVVAL